MSAHVGLATAYSSVVGTMSAVLARVCPVSAGPTVVSLAGLASSPRLSGKRVVRPWWVWLA